MRILVEIHELPEILENIREIIDPDNPTEDFLHDKGVSEVFCNVINHLLGVEELTSDMVLRELQGSDIVETIENLIERYLLRVCALEWVESVSLSTLHGCLLIHLIGDYTACLPRSRLR